MIQSNPALAALITETIGDGWRSDFNRIGDLSEYAGNAELALRLREVKRQNKLRLAAYIKKESGIDVDTDSVFDIQVKRIHAYKRQIGRAHV